MPEPTSPHELTDLAWDAAHAANRGFDRVEEINRNIEGLRVVESLGLAGVIISGEAKGELERQFADAQRDFEVYKGMTALAMSVSTDSFTLQSESEVEPTPDIEAHDLAIFGTAQGYHKGQAMWVWRILEREEISLNPVELYGVVKGWLERDPEIRNLGPKGISFLADYINGQLPHLEPLEVTHPPESRKDKAREVKELSPHELLLDRVKIDDVEVECVSRAAFARFALSQGHSLGGHHVDLFLSLVRLIDPASARKPDFDIEQPAMIGEYIVYMGGYIRDSSGWVYGDALWGITPARFLNLLVEAELSQEIERQIKNFKGINRLLIYQYVTALRALLA